MVKGTKFPRSRTSAQRKYAWPPSGVGCCRDADQAPGQDHESIDFTDNDISTLGNFPLSPRLQTLLCARNRISSIQPSLPKSVPNLSTLVLTQNGLSELADLDPLQGFPKLTHVSLMENPVTGKEVSRQRARARARVVRRTPD